jgi:hypothetical protein
MSRALAVENQTASPVTLDDLSVTVPASGSLVLTDTFSLGHIWRSADLRAAIDSGDLLVSDGGTQLTKSQSLASVTEALTAPADLRTYNVYAAAQQSFTGITTVACATERRANPAFSVDALGQIMVNVEGRYIVRARCTALGGSGSRQEVSVWLELNGAEVEGTRGELYRRNATTGGSCSMDAELDLLVSDTLRIRAEVTQGGSAVTLREHGSSVVLLRIGR